MRTHPPGAVDRVLPGLFRGYIDRFALDDNAHDLSLEVWLSICVNADKLARDPAKPGRPDGEA